MIFCISVVSAVIYPFFISNFIDLNLFPFFLMNRAEDLSVLSSSKFFIFINHYYSFLFFSFTSALIFIISFILVLIFIVKYNIY